MPRGQRSIFLSLFQDEASAAITLDAPPERRGRSEALIIKRNELLISRYYYYVKVRRSQYKDALESLENELFITERRIVDVIQHNSKLLRELHEMKPDLQYFRGKYPFMRWL